MRLSTEAVGIISHVFCVKVGSDRKAWFYSTRWCLERLLTASDISTHAKQLIFPPELKSCGVANCIDWKFGL